MNQLASKFNFWIIGNRKKFYATVFIVLIFTVSFCESKFTSTIVITNIANRPACKDFATWDLAEAAYKSDPIKYKSLDHNNNGVACEIMKQLESK